MLLSQAMDGPAGQVKIYRAALGSDLMMIGAAELAFTPVPGRSRGHRHNHRHPAPHPRPRQADRAQKAGNFTDGRALRTAGRVGRPPPTSSRDGNRRQPARLSKSTASPSCRTTPPRPDRRRARLGPGAMAQSGGGWKVDLRRRPAATGDHEPVNGNALHGLLSGAAYRVAAGRRTASRWRPMSRRHRATPFNSRRAVRYQLAEDGLLVTHSLTNTGTGQPRSPSGAPLPQAGRCAHGRPDARHQCRHAHRGQ